MLGSQITPFSILHLISNTFFSKIKLTRMAMFKLNKSDRNRDCITLKCNNIAIENDFTKKHTLYSVEKYNF